MTSHPPAAEAPLPARAAQLLYAYTRAVDEGDLDALATMVVDDVAITRADGTRTGRDAFVAVYRGFRDSGKTVSRHAVTNVQAFPVGMSSIRVLAYFSATIVDPHATRLVVGTYDDEVLDGVDGLRFTHKRVLVETVLPLPAAGAYVPPTPKES